MNPPKIIFFPSIEKEDTRIKYTPQDEGETIKRFIEKGYAILVNGTKKPTKEINELCGLYCETNSTILHPTQDYNDEHANKIFCLIFWQEPLTPHQLQYAHAHFSNLFGLHVDPPRKLRSSHSVVEPPKQECFYTPDFSGMCVEADKLVTRVHGGDGEDRVAKLINEIREATAATAPLDVSAGGV